MRHAASVLERAGVPDARAEAQRLLAHLLDTDRGGVVAAGPDALPPEVAARYKRWVARRAGREPFQHITGVQEFYGLEYGSCCWGLRVVSRRYISTRDGTRDTTFGLQLVLKGMTSVGTAADKMLERGILGYSADPE